MRKINESNYSFVTSACPYEIIRLPLDDFSWNFIFKHISKIFKKYIQVSLTRITSTLHKNLCTFVTVKVKWSRYRPGVVQRVGSGIALLFHDRGIRREWVVSSTPRPHFTPWERPGTHFTGDWVGTRAGLDGRKISSPPGFDPGPSSPQSVAIPTELPGPQHLLQYLTELFLEYEMFHRWKLQGKSNTVH